ncbi:adaptin ear-binding coat-associated protein 1 [Pitangus sulphuratus]|nr:adaptin ear-binding coat-associated protein 1 [Pitangus sulphuratus]
MVEELCHQVKELQEEANRLHRIQMNKQEIDQLFTEMLQSQNSQESRTSIAVEKQVDSEPCNYRLFRRDRQGRRGRGVAQYVIEGLGCLELTVGNGTVESLWVRIKGQTNNVDVIMGVYYRPLSQDSDANKLFFEELKDTLKSTALVLMRDFNLPEITWEHHTAGTTWARRFLKNLDDNFMEQVLRKMTQKDALLDMLLVNRVDLVSEVEICGHLGHSKHEAVEFRISVDRRKSANKTSTLAMRKADFRLLRELVSKDRGKMLLQMLGSISAGHFLNITS